MDCLRRRAPAAAFGKYDSREYNDLIYAKEEEQQYAQERAYRRRKARLEEQNRREQEQQAQNQVFTLPARRLRMPDSGGGTETLPGVRGYIRSCAESPSRRRDSDMCGACPP